MNRLVLYFIHHSTHLIQSHVDTYKIQNYEERYSQIVCNSHLKLLIISAVLSDPKRLGFQRHSQQVSVSDGVDKYRDNQRNVLFYPLQYPTTF